MQREICACCLLRGAPERFSRTDKRPPVCAECVQHISNPEKRNSEHLRDWRRAYQAMAASYESRLTNMRALQDKSDEELAEVRSALAEAINTISGDYHKAPIGDLRNALETELVTQERDRAESAYRVRSRAMAVIWRADQLHNTLEVKSPTVCKCGTPADRCKMLEVLKPFVEELDKWEANEKERMRAGKTHGLPREHPEAVRYMQGMGNLWRGPGWFEDSSRTVAWGRR